jgi:hypothetical protein
VLNREQSDEMKKRERGFAKSVGEAIMNSAMGCQVKENDKVDLISQIKIIIKISIKVEH